MIPWYVNMSNSWPKSWDNDKLIKVYWNKLQSIILNQIMFFSKKILSSFTVSIIFFNPIVGSDQNLTNN